MINDKNVYNVNVILYQYCNVNKSKLDMNGKYLTICDQNWYVAVREPKQKTKKQQHTKNWFRGH